MRIAVLIASMILLAGCAGQEGNGPALSVGPGPAVTGNQQGGRVPYIEGGMQSSMASMNAHCAQYGKKAQITQMKPGEQGGVLEFECHGHKI